MTLIDHQPEFLNAIENAESEIITRGQYRGRRWVTNAEIRRVWSVVRQRGNDLGERRQAIHALADAGWEPHKFWGIRGMVRPEETSD